ncbi:MAG: hypothetical protein J6J64_02460 [Alistipes sp.]|nr:hypothetical protein [Alistipes sp.]
MSTQEWIVALVAVVVGIVVVHKVVRFFRCPTESSCDGCSKECSHRRGK